MRELIAKWRREANEQPETELGEIRALMLLDHARELEQAWHDRSHDGAWHPDDCAVCDREFSKFRGIQKSRVTIDEQGMLLVRRRRAGENRRAVTETKPL